MTPSRLKEILDAKVEQYECPSFIDNDPISIPHSWSQKNDIEISGFLASTLAWGNRKAILKSTKELMSRLDNAPYDFVLNATEKDILGLNTFVYRTFQKEDLPCFVRALQHIYKDLGGLERVMTTGGDLQSSIISLREAMLPYLDGHASKHVANPANKSAAKRICMFLRWMVRSSAKGVDFGLWKGISPSDLVLPLDVHVGNIALELDLIERNGKDWKTAVAITDKLRQFRPEDPVAYDFALFSMDMED